MIVATGATARQLGLPERGPAAGPRRLVLRGLRRGVLPQQRVLVVGGGDSALEEATFLAKFASEVVVVHRRSEFRASKIMQDYARAKDNVRFLTPYVGRGGARRGRRPVTGAAAAQRRDRRGARRGGRRPVRGDRSRPEHLALPGLARPRRRRLPGGRSPARRATNIDGVFAAGDVADHVYRQAITAAGSGCAAALDAERWLAHGGSPSRQQRGLIRGPRRCVGSGEDTGARRRHPLLHLPQLRQRARSTTTGAKASRTRPSAATAAASASCSSCSRTTTRRPAPGMLACDREGRILSAGRGVFELTGFAEGDLMGKDLREALALAGEDGKDPVGTVLEWGVRQIDQRDDPAPAGPGLQKPVRCDFFPAYDDDGGMLASRRSGERPGRPAAPRSALAAALAGPARPRRATAQAAHAGRPALHPRAALRRERRALERPRAGHVRERGAHAARARLPAALGQRDRPAARRRAIARRDVQGGRPGALEVGCTALPIDARHAGRRRAAARGSASTSRSTCRGATTASAASAARCWSATPSRCSRSRTATAGTSTRTCPIGESFYSQVGHFRVTFDTPGRGQGREHRRDAPDRAARQPACCGRRRAAVRDFAWVAGPLRGDEPHGAPRHAGAASGRSPTRRPRSRSDARSGDRRRRRPTTRASAAIPYPGARRGRSATSPGSAAWSTRPSSSPSRSTSPWCTRSPTSGGTGSSATTSSTTPGSTRLRHLDRGPPRRHRRRRCAPGALARAGRPRHQRHGLLGPAPARVRPDGLHRGRRARCRPCRTCSARTASPAC